MTAFRKPGPVPRNYDANATPRPHQSHTATTRRPRHCHTTPIDQQGGSGWVSRTPRAPLRWGELTARESLPTSAQLDRRDVLIQVPRAYD
jgi:hypothetical protein